MAAVKIAARVGVAAGALAAALGAGAAFGEEGGLNRVVARLESFYRASPGITADFVQVLESRTLGRPQEESGTLSLKPPGRMRWEYKSPRGKMAITDGKQAYLYLPEDRQVIVGKIGEMGSGAITTRLLMGTGPLSGDFRVEGEPSPQRPGLWILKLVPREAGFPYDAVTLEVEEATGGIRSIRLLDPLGNRTVYRFEHLQVVRDLPDQIFTYRIPRGVDVQVLGEAADRPSSP